MADLEGSQVPETADDVEMAGEEEVADPADDGVTDPEETQVPASNPQTVFLDYLKSPIVRLVIGSGDEETTITAHSAILERSPYFGDKIAGVSPENLQIDFPDESLDAFGCFLQYQYTGEYFPRRLASVPDGLEPDPSLPAVDDTGSQLLKHARVYTLAEKLGLPELKTLAHSKIHRINSTAVGEIAYARYVYANTPADDVTIRKPRGGILGDEIACAAARGGVGVQDDVSGVPAVWL